MSDVRTMQRATHDQEIERTEVVVVGAGPVGLSMSLELSRQGIANVVVEQTVRPSHHPKVATVGPRSMEFMRSWGVADRIREAGWPADHLLDIVWATQVGGHEIFRIVEGVTAGRALPDYSPEREAICPQTWLVPILHDAVRHREGTCVQTGVEVVDVVPVGDGVDVTMRSTSGRVSRLRAAYVVGCDGASSSVRRMCGIPMISAYEPQRFRNILFQSPELHTRLGADEALVYFLMNPEGLRYPLRAIDGRGLYRLTVDSGEGASASAATEIVRRAIAFDCSVTIVDEDEWTLAHKVAETYRHNRVFLAGDAAHCLSPSGGFGMNTGIADAANLGWKLAARLQGWGTDALLDTYVEERRPVALAALEESNRNLRRTLDRRLPPAIMDDGVEGAAIRRAMGERFRESGVAREFSAPEIHFGYSYQPAVRRPSTDPVAADWQKSAVLGVRFPHVWLAEGRSTIDWFGSAFVLVQGADVDGKSASVRGAAADAFWERQIPLEYRELPAGAGVLEPGGGALVRPDGHCAWVGRLDQGDWPELAARVSYQAPVGTSEPSGLAS